jgi:hypothetical protein
MPTPQDTESRAAVKEFLLAEYHNVADSFWKNEQTGETRVNWFLGIITAGAAGLIGLASAEHNREIQILLTYPSALVVFLLAALWQYKWIERKERKRK